MKIGHYTIHANPGGVLDCACLVDLTCDGETIAFEFPQITQKEDNIGPSVYACMDGTELTVRLTDRHDIEWSFVWNEDEGKWYQRNTSNLTDSRPDAAAGSGTADPRVGRK